MFTHNELEQALLEYGVMYERTPDGYDIEAGIVECRDLGTDGFEVLVSCEPHTSQYLFLSSWNGRRLKTAEEAKAFASRTMELA